jgi:tetratricopeptide (TPR) repeat protein
MVFLATTAGEAGDVQHASDILRFVVQTYPKDSSAEFDLGLTLSAQPTEQIAAFKRSIDLDPDLIAGYESLGAALYSARLGDQALEVFRKGLAIDPLSPSLNYNLGLLLTRTGEISEGNRRMALAAKVDPDIAAKLQGSRK